MVGIKFNFCYVRQIQWKKPLTANFEVKFGTNYSRMDQVQFVEDSI